MKKFILYIPLLLVFAGCQTVPLSPQAKNHILQHKIEVNLNQSVQGFISFPSIEHRITQDNIYLSIQGLIRKPLGKQLSKAKIKATFLDENGNTLFEEVGDVSVSRTHLHRGLKGRFFIKADDKETISTCRLNVEWSGDKDL
jgi:hypothetical protein